MRTPFIEALLTMLHRPSVTLLVALLPVTSVAAQPPSVAAPASIQGIATDSVRGGVLAGAYIELRPTGRQVQTNARGVFRFDSVPPHGAYQLHVMHALLDTLGVALATPEFPLHASESRNVDVGVPSARRIVRILCGPAQLARGPSALVGFVRDPDSGAAVDSITISLVYDESPLSHIDLPVNKPVTIVTTPVKREAQPDALGRYAICGLPPRMSGRVQLIRNGVESADIPVATSAGSPLALRALGMSLTAHRGIAGVDSAGKPRRILRGDARLTGRVVSKAGQAVAGARVQMNGTLAAAVTRDDGSFTLDSVPTGTHAISVRKLGFGVTDKAVDVARNEEASVTVLMADFVPMLAPVVTVSQRTKDLEASGFSRRKTQGFGFFLEGEQIDRGPPTLGEALRMIPGLRVGYDAQNRTAQKAVIMPSRGSRVQCLRYIVDGTPWQEVGGDIEKFVRPGEIEALEMYNAASIPGEFSDVSRGRCSVLVIWTTHKIRRARKGS